MELTTSEQVLAILILLWVLLAPLASAIVTRGQVAIHRP